MSDLQRETTVAIFRAVSLSAIAQLVVTSPVEEYPTTAERSMRRCGGVLPLSLAYLRCVSIPPCADYRKCPQL